MVPKPEALWTAGEPSGTVGNVGLRERSVSKRLGTGIRRGERSGAALPTVDRARPDYTVGIIDRRVDFSR
jgi:hypothetical protein